MPDHTPLSTGPTSRTTLADVARRARVGVMTVSRALRDPGSVSEPLRERVLAAVAELGYRANPAASALSSGRSAVVPVIVPTLAHPVYVAFLKGVHDGLASAGGLQHVMVTTTEYDPVVEAQQVQALLDWRPAGMMVAGVEHSETTRKLLVAARDAGMPVVEFMDLASAPIDINIGFSHSAVGESVGRWLGERGHQEVACISAMGHLDVRARKRSLAFTSMLTARGVRVHDVRLEGPSSMAAGAHGLTEALSGSGILDAVFCANDDIAAGAILEAQRRGLSVPDDLAVVGFNDCDMASMFHPAITSVHIEREAMGRRAAELLLSRSASPGQRPVRIDMGFHIVERASTAGRSRI